MEQIKVPESYNYVAAFLTMRCNLGCSYCINAHDKPFTRDYQEMSAKQWKQALNRLDVGDLPITIQGGEPTVKKNFYNILNGVDSTWSLSKQAKRFDLLTNGQFDIAEFVYKLSPFKFRSFEGIDDSVMASIRMSYHPEQMDLEDTIKRASMLKDLKYSVGIGTVLHPDYSFEVLNAQAKCERAGIPFFAKDFLGFHEGQLFGTYEYKGAVSEGVVPTESVECKTDELLIAPDGKVHRCHRDLYRQENAVGHILDPKFTIDDIFRDCDNFGECNPCDVKVKKNKDLSEKRVSVEIRKREVEE